MRWRCSSAHAGRKPHNIAGLGNMVKPSSSALPRQSGTADTLAGTEWARAQRLDHHRLSLSRSLSRASCYFSALVLKPFCDSGPLTRPSVAARPWGSLSRPRLHVSGSDRGCGRGVLETNKAQSRLRPQVCICFGQVLVSDRPATLGAVVDQRWGRFGQIREQHMRRSLPDVEWQRLIVG